MDVITALKARRAYRSLAPFAVTKELAEDLATAASLAPSCINKQPWRFVFAYDKEVLEKLRPALSKGNEWAYEALMIVAVFSKKELDCVMKDGREYWLFDTGMAVMSLILRATELGLVAHPIAGYDPAKAKEVLNIPDEMTLVTLINVGQHSQELSSRLSQDQAKAEQQRPLRLPFKEFAFHNKYQ